MIIYKITNKINGKIYIGQTTQSLTRRWKQHCNNAKNKRYALRNAIIKYGAINFTVEQIDTAWSREELDQKEIYWIEYYKSMFPNGYNLTTGGKHCEISEELRVRLSAVNKGKKPSKKCIEQSVKARKGKKLSEEHRKKMGESHKGEKSHFFGRRLYGSDNPRYGKHLSEESKRKISENRKGKYGGGKNPRARKVICIENGFVFDCIIDAAKSINKSSYNLRDHLKGKTKQCGGYHWMYYTPNNGGELNGRDED